MMRNHRGNQRNVIRVFTTSDAAGQAFNYVLAAAVVSGALQTLLGIFKLGRIADIFHGSVIQGLLAAIGIIIFAKQIHVALGTHSDGANIVDNLVLTILRSIQMMRNVSLKR